MPDPKDVARAFGEDGPAPEDPGDLLAVPEEEQLDVDPDPVEDEAHAALGDGGADDVSDVTEGEYVDPSSYDEEG